MSCSIAHVSLLVREYAEALHLFTERLGFRLAEDTALGDGKRWVLVSPSPEPSASLLLARANTPEQRAIVGRQAGDRVFLFLHTEIFSRNHAKLRASRRRFLAEPREESYGTFAVFEDLYGSKWDLLEPRTPPLPS